MYRNAIVILGMSVIVGRDSITTQHKHAMSCTASDNTSLGVGIKRKENTEDHQSGSHQKNSKASRHKKHK